MSKVQKVFSALGLAPSASEMPDPTAMLRKQQDEAREAQAKAQEEAEARETKTRTEQQTRAAARRSGRAGVSDLISLGTGGANVARPTLG